MSPTLVAGPKAVLAVLLLLAAAFTLTSCGHTEAAPPEISQDTVMQTVRDYGRGHQGTPAPAFTDSADATEGAELSYAEHVRSLVDQANYAELESLAQTNRLERGRFLGGNWRNNDFFNGATWANPNDKPTDSDYQHQIEKLKKWQAARPDSAAAKIALAKIYVFYANFARGDGYAASVSDKQWDLYNSRTALAKQTLLEAAAFKERDPHWYIIMQEVAHNEGWGKADARELLDRAIAFEPDYFHFYRLYTQYLLPQWYGDHGEIPDFAEEVASKHPEPAGSILYFQIVSTLACYCEIQMGELKGADWQKLQLGFANLQATYGLSNLNANRFAEMATAFGDRAVAHEAFSHVVKREAMVWYAEDSYQQARAWAGVSNDQ